MPAAVADNTMTTIDFIAIRRFEVERATVISAKPFGTVVAKLTAAIGRMDLGEFAREVAAARTASDLERIVGAAAFGR